MSSISTGVLLVNNDIADYGSVGFYVPEFEISISKNSITVNVTFVPYVSTEWDYDVDVVPQVLAVMDELYNSGWAIDTCRAKFVQGTLNPSAEVTYTP